MKVSRLAFTSAIAMAAKVVTTRATLPILESIRLEARPAMLTISATDLDRRVYLEIPAEGEWTPGATLVNAKVLQRLLKTLDTELLELAWGERSIEEGEEVELDLLIDGFKIPGLHPKDFPDVPSLIGQPAAAIQGLYSALEFCLPFISRDESRYNLNGAFVKSGKDKDKVSAVSATDGHQLAHAWLPKSTIPTNVIVSRSVLETLFSGPFKLARQPDMIAIDDKGNVSFPLSRTGAYLGGLQGYLSSRIIEGTFPKVDNVIPAGTAPHAVIETNRLDMITALARAIAVSDDTRCAPVTLVGDPERSLTIDSGNTELPCPGGVVPANGHSGAVCKGVNAYYLKGALQALTEVKAEIHVPDDIAPLWLSEGKMSSGKVPATWQQGKRTIVIMPMRTELSKKPAPAPAPAPEPVAVEG